MERRNGIWRPEATVDLSSCLAQQRAHKRFRPGNRVCLPWGRGVGKSWAMRQFFYLLIAQFGQVVRQKADGSATRGVRITLAMPTLTQARRVHIGASPGLLDELAGPWSFLGGVMNFATWRVNFPSYHSWIQFVTTDRPESARGIRTDVGAFDEADDIDPEFYHAIAGPMFSEPHSLNMTLVAGTPKRGRNGFLYLAHKAWPEMLPGKAFSFHATGYDTKHVLPERIEEQRLTTPEELFKREWLCDFDATEGRVYGEFNEHFHVRKPPPNQQYSQILIGGDHGKIDPTVLLVIGIAGKGRDATAHVLEEYYEAGRDPFYWQAIAKRLVARFPLALWYCDPAGYGTSNSLYQVVGARVRDVDKSAGSVEAGISVVRRWLKVQSVPRAPIFVGAESEPGEQRESDQFARLYVDPSCRNTIREFGLYRHKRDRQNGETLLEDILHGNDHAMDSLRYPLYNHFPDMHASYRLGNLAPG